MKKSIVCACFLALFTIGCGEKPDFWPVVNFDKEKWSRTEDEGRYIFARDIINKKRLLGMSQQEVIALLGPPSFVDGQSSYVTYVLKVSSGNLYILDIRFKQTDQVSVVEDVFVRAD